jgi:DNA-binding MarR family transcriptional regulator
MQTNVATDPDYELWYLFHQTSDAMGRARENELRQIGISRMQRAVLFIVKAVKVPATPAEISRWLFREPHTVSGLLNRMEKQGLVRKVKDLERKNLIRVVITEKGEEAYNRSRETKVVHKILSCLSPKKKDNLRAYLKRLRNEALAQTGVRHQLPFP